MRLVLCGAVALFTHLTFAQTWQTVDDFQLAPGKYSSAIGATVDRANGIMYVGGNGDDASGGHGILKRSMDGGATWTEPQLITGGWSFRGPSSDAVGNLYTASGGVVYWRVLRSQDAGLTWSRVDDVVTTTSPTAACATATDAAGNVFAGGQLGGNWAVRKGTTNPDGTMAWFHGGFFRRRIRQGGVLSSERRSVRRRR